MQFNSLSSSLIFGLSLYHNQAGCLNKVLSTPGYALIGVISVIETAVALIFSAIAIALFDHSGSNKSLNFCTEWVKSSSFAIIWSLVDALISPITRVVVADEASARKIARSGNIMHFPSEAILHLPSTPIVKPAN